MTSEELAGRFASALSLARRQLRRAQRCWEILQLRSKDVNKALEPPYGILALKCQLLFRHCTLIISDRPLLNGLFSLLRE